MVAQHTTVAGAEHSWVVDADAAGRAMRWAARRPQTLAADLTGMATYFPHWLLVGTQAGRTTRCERCALPSVPARGALRCPACGEATPANGLRWVGHLPALARLEPAFQRRRAALQAAGFEEAQIEEQGYLLVPLSVTYPGEWPSVEPAVRYAPRWLEALGLPRASAAHHLVGVGQACLFAWGQWQATPIHFVLQQRVVNHVASLLKIAAGARPEEAFIGRIHHEAWEPEP
jgi:hypothetical protein